VYLILFALLFLFIFKSHNEQHLPVIGKEDDNYWKEKSFEFEEVVPEGRIMPNNVNDLQDTCTLGTCTSTDNTSICPDEE